MDWREHMKGNVLDWLTKGDRTMRLDANFLMLFGNPYLFQEEKFRALFSRVSSCGTFYRGVCQGQALSFCHPLFGAPMVAMVTEILAELGVETIVACGYVGGLGADADIGSYLIPASATGLDGCTRARFPEHASFEASAVVTAALKKAVDESGAQSRSGNVVSIDALLLEDDRMIGDFVARGCHAVDLETACLYSLGAHLGIRVAGLHIVSDHPAGKLVDRARVHEAVFAEQVTLAVAALGHMAAASDA